MLFYFKIYIVCNDMKMRVADYIVKLLIENNIMQSFVVVGGGAMHLDDALGYHEGMKCIFNHHEQACVMAAESYARVNNRMAVACVTSGPGGTNAITGVLCAWNDNIPLLVLSGQVRTDTTIGSTGLNLRQFGEQEYDIVKSVENMTKYAEMITDYRKIRYCVEKAIYLANSGRRGPCWLDIPLDIQGMQIEIDEQIPYIPIKEENEKDVNKIAKAMEILMMAKRPVIIAGSAIRGAGVYDQFRKFVDRVELPVVAATGIADLFPVDYKYYYGNFGIIGGRAGNFIVQNADCILILGARLSFKQIGFNYEKFAPKAYKIMVDIDEEEMKKKTISLDLPIHIDLKDFFNIIDSKRLNKFGFDRNWHTYCDEVKKKYPIYQNYFEMSDKVNPYFFTRKMQQYLNNKSIVVVGNSCACDMTRQMGITEEGQRLWGNTNCGTMGYDLPAAIGAAAASSQMVFCVTGDGSIMMNLQELQTIVHNDLSVKIIIHNNEGYEAIVNTHTNFFGRLTGCTKKSGISFPDFKLLAKAFGMPYYLCKNHNDVEEILPDFINLKGYGICEVWSDEKQLIEPKTKSKVLENGKMYSPPIDDLYPFLDEEEYNQYANYNQYLKVKEKRI